MKRTIYVHSNTSLLNCIQGLHSLRWPSRWTTIFTPHVIWPVSQSSLPRKSLSLAEVKSPPTPETLYWVSQIEVESPVYNTKSPPCENPPSIFGYFFYTILNRINYVFVVKERVLCLLFERNLIVFIPKIIFLYWHYLACNLTPLGCQACNVHMQLHTVERLQFVIQLGKWVWLQKDILFVLLKGSETSMGITISALASWF